MCTVAAKWADSRIRSFFPQTFFLLASLKGSLFHCNAAADQNQYANSNDDIDCIWVWTCAFARFLRAYPTLTIRSYAASFQITSIATWLGNTSLRLIFRHLFTPAELHEVKFYSAIYMRNAIITWALPASLTGLPFAKFKARVELRIFCCIEIVVARAVVDRRGQAYPVI